MKKLLSILLSVAMSLTAMTSLSFAETSETVQEANEYTMPYWTIDRPDYVQRVYNEDRQSWEAKITNDGSDWSYHITYYIPTDKLTAGHTYSFSAYLRTEGQPSTWIALDLGGKTDFTPYVPNQNNGGTQGVGGLTGLQGNNKIAFGLTNANDCVLYVDDVVIKDEQTGEILDLPNLDFETTVEPPIIQTGAEYLPGWTINDTVSRYYNPTRESWEAMITTDTSTVQWKPLIYYFPKSFLTDEHTYTVEAYVRTEGLTASGQNWLNIEHAGNQKTPDAYDYHSGAVSRITGLKAENFNNHNKISFGFTKAKGTIMYVDDVKLIDEQTGETLRIENGDFEHIESDYVSDDMPGWTPINNATTTVKRVYNFNVGSWMAKIENTGSAEWCSIRYTIPKTRINPEHTYSVSAYVLTENDTGSAKWVIFEVGGGNINPPGVQNTRGVVLTRSGINGSALHQGSQNKLGIGMTGTLSCNLYIDNVVLTDETTGEVISLENADLEKSSADYREEITAVTAPEWTANINEHVDIYKAFDIERDSWGVVIDNLGTSGSWGYLTYTVPAALISPDHTYTIKTYIKTLSYSSSSQWVAYCFAGKDDTPGVAGLNQTWVRSGITGSAILGNNTLRIGLTASNAATIFVDDLVLIDETTGDTVPLYNGDFESGLEDGITFEGNNGGQAVATVISTKDNSYGAYLAWAIYSTDEDGTEVLEKVNVTPITIEKADTVQYLVATPEIEAGCTSKAFIWNASTLKPLADAVEFVAVDAVN